MNVVPRIHRVLIAEDHPVMREGLKLTIELKCNMQVIAEAADGAEAIEYYRHHRPDVTLMDLRMPHVDGLHAIRAIRSFNPEAAIVVLTTYAGDARVSTALGLGAASYLLKTATSAEILEAVEAALAGRETLPPAIRRELSARQGAETLSEREIDVLRLIALGTQNRLIGRELHISENTVKTRVRNILDKLEARDRTHAVTIAVERGFLNT